MKPWVRRLGIGIGVLVVAGAAAAVAMIGPRNVIGMLRYDQRQEGALKVGDPAPDVVLTALDGSTQVHLHDRIGPRPVVLILGSYT
jgi:hypothetical protein